MSQSARSPGNDRTAMIPVMTMEEVPVLDALERAQMLASLQEAEARIAAGQFTVYDPLTFRVRLLAVYRKAKAAMSA